MLDHPDLRLVDPMLDIIPIIEALDEPSKDNSAILRAILKLRGAYADLKGLVSAPSQPPTSPSA